MAIVYFSSANDSGTGSLRAAIASASSGDTIKPDPSGDWSSRLITINLASTLEITKSLTFDGGDYRVRLNGGHVGGASSYTTAGVQGVYVHYPIVNSSPDKSYPVNVTFIKYDIVNCFTNNGHGGGINYIGGVSVNNDPVLNTKHNTLRMEKCKVLGCYAESMGGGVCAVDCDVLLKDSLFACNMTSNTSDDPEKVVVYGNSLAIGYNSEDSGSVYDTTNKIYGCTFAGTDDDIWVGITSGNQPSYDNTIITKSKTLSRSFNEQQIGFVRVLGDLTGHTFQDTYYENWTSGLWEQLDFHLKDVDYTTSYTSGSSTYNVTNPFSDPNSSGWPYVSQLELTETDLDGWPRGMNVVTSNPSYTNGNNSNHASAGCYETIAADYYWIDSNNPSSSTFANTSGWSRSRFSSIALSSNEKPTASSRVFIGQDVSYSDIISSTSPSSYPTLIVDQDKTLTLNQPTYLVGTDSGSAGPDVVMYAASALGEGARIIRPIGTLNSPTLTGVSAGLRSAIVNIGEVSNAESYAVDYSTSSSFDTYQTATFNASGNQTITGLNTDTTYYFRAKALATNYTTSSYSSSVTLTTENGTLATPSSFDYTVRPTTVNGNTVYVLTLLWNAVPDAESYTVTFNGNTYTTTSTSYEISGVTYNTSYPASVKATGTGLTDSSVAQMGVNFFVNNANSGDGTLRQSMSNSSAGDVIKYGGDQTGDIEVPLDSSLSPKDMEIRGSLSQRIILNGKGTIRFFGVTSSVSMSFRYVDFKNGKQTNTTAPFYVAALAVTDTLTFDCCRFYGGNGYYSAFIQCAQAASKGTVNFTNCIGFNNTNTSSRASEIFASSAASVNINVTGCTFIRTGSSASITNNGSGTLNVSNTLYDELSGFDPTTAGFVDATNYDFRLTSSSSYLTGGSSTGTDYLGHARSGSVGAYDGSWYVGDNSKVLSSNQTVYYAEFEGSSSINSDAILTVTKELSFRTSSVSSTTNGYIVGPTGTDSTNATLTNVDLCLFSGAGISGFSASENGNEADLSWTSTDSSKSVLVQRLSGSSYATLATTVGSTYVDSTHTSGDSDSYRIFDGQTILDAVISSTGLIVPSISCASITATSATLNFGNLQNATSYVLQYGTDSTFTTKTEVAYPVLDSTGTQTVSGLTANTKYYFRVKATSEGGVETNWSNAINATTKLATPTLSSLTPGTNQVSLSIGSVIGASSYVLEYSTDSTFATKSTETYASSGSKTVTSLSANTTYYFRAKVTSSTNESEYSSTSNATTLKITLTAPTFTSSANTKNSITVSIGSVTNATSYVVEYSTDSGFANPSTETYNSSGSKTISGLSANTKYYLRVKATASGYNDSNYTSINVTTDKDKLGTPTLSISSVSENSVSLAIGNVSNASQYVVEYATNSSFTSSSTKSFASSGTKTISSLSANTTYYFRVVAKNNNYYDSDASSVVYDTTSQSTLSTPTLAKSSVTDHTATLTIGSVTNASKYVVQYATNSSFTSASSVEFDSSGSQTVTDLSANTLYYFRVKATATGYVDSSWSTSVNDTTEKETLTAPTFAVSSVTHNSATVAIGSVTNATNYVLHYSTSSSFGSYQTVQYDSSGSKTISSLSSNTTYYFRVKAQGTGYNDSSWATDSETTDLPTLTTPTLSGFAYSQDTIKLQIGFTDNTSTYVVRYSTDSSFLSYQDATFYVPGVQQITGLSANTTYYFKAKSTGSGYNDSAFSTAIDITTGKPTLETPVCSVSEVTTDSITIELTSAVYGAESYALEYGTDSSFATKTSVSASVGDNEIENLTPNTTYYFRIIASGTGYNDSQPSETITQATAKVKLSTPTNLAYTATTDSLTFTWSAVQGAEEYAVSLDGTEQMASTNSYTFSNLSDNTTYAFLVYATSSNNADSDSAGLNATTDRLASTVYFTNANDAGSGSLRYVLENTAIDGDNIAPDPSAFADSLIEITLATPIEVDKNCSFIGNGKRIRLNGNGVTGCLTTASTATSVSFTNYDFVNSLDNTPAIALHNNTSAVFNYCVIAGNKGSTIFQVGTNSSESCSIQFNNGAIFNNYVGDNVISGDKRFSLTNSTIALNKASSDSISAINITSANVVLGVTVTNSIVVGRDAPQLSCIDSVAVSDNADVDFYSPDSFAFLSAINVTQGWRNNSSKLYALEPNYTSPASRKAQYGSGASDLLGQSRTGAVGAIENTSGLNVWTSKTVPSTAVINDSNLVIKITGDDIVATFNCAISAKKLSVTGEDAEVVFNENVTLTEDANFSGLGSNATFAKNITAGVVQTSGCANVEVDSSSVVNEQTVIDYGEYQITDDGPTVAFSGTVAVQNFYISGAGSTVTFNSGANAGTYSGGTLYINGLDSVANLYSVDFQNVILNNGTIKAKSNLLLKNLAVNTANAVVGTISDTEYYIEPVPQIVFEGTDRIVRVSTSLTSGNSNNIVVGTFSADNGNGYFVVNSSVQTNNGTFTGVKLAYYGANVSNFTGTAERSLAWSVTSSSVSTLVEKQIGATWSTVQQTTGQTYSDVDPGEVTYRIFDGEKFLSYTFEARIAKTVYFYTNIDSADNVNSLRYVLNNAIDGDVIMPNSSSFSGTGPITINLTESLTTDKAVTLSGNGRRVRLNAGGDFEVFEAEDDVTISDYDFVNGSSDGACVQLGDNAVLTRCLIAGNSGVNSLKCGSGSSLSTCIVFNNNNSGTCVDLTSGSSVSQTTIAFNTCDEVLSGCACQKSIIGGTCSNTTFSDSVHSDDVHRGFFSEDVSMFVTNSDTGTHNFESASNIDKYYVCEPNYISDYMNVYTSDNSTDFNGVLLNGTIGALANTSGLGIWYLNESLNLSSISQIVNANITIGDISDGGTVTFSNNVTAANFTMQDGDVMFSGGSTVNITTASINDGTITNSSSTVSITTLTSSSGVDMRSVGTATYNAGTWTGVGDVKPMDNGSLTLNIATSVSASEIFVANATGGSLTCSSFRASTNVGLTDVTASSSCVIGGIGSISGSLQTNSLAFEKDFTVGSITASVIYITDAYITTGSISNGYMLTMSSYSKESVLYVTTSVGIPNSVSGTGYITSRFYTALNTWLESNRGNNYIYAANYGANVQSFSAYTASENETEAQFKLSRKDSTKTVLLERKKANGGYEVVENYWDGTGTYPMSENTETTTFRVFDGQKFISDLVVVSPPDTDYYVYKISNYCFSNTIKPYRYEPVIFMAQIRNTKTGQLIARSDVDSVVLTLFKASGLMYGNVDWIEVDNWTNVQIDKKCVLEETKAYDIWQVDDIGANFLWMPDQSSETFVNESGNYAARFLITLNNNDEVVLTAKFEVL